MTHLQSFKVVALIFCEGTESVWFILLKGPTLQGFSSSCRGIVVSCPAWFPFISPTGICPSNTKSNRCAYHNANWLENCVGRVCAEFWPRRHRPFWPRGWKLENTICTCLCLLNVAWLLGRWCTLLLALKAAVTSSVRTKSYLSQQTSSWS